MKSACPSTVCFIKLSFTFILKCSGAKFLCIGTVDVTVTVVLPMLSHISLPSVQSITVLLVSKFII